MSCTYKNATIQYNESNEILKQKSNLPCTKGKQKRIIIIFVEYLNIQKECYTSVLMARLNIHIYFTEFHNSVLLITGSRSLEFLGYLQIT